MWTRCFPATKKVQEEIDGGSIGKVTQVGGIIAKAWPPPSHATLALFSLSLRLYKSRCQAVRTITKLQIKQPCTFSLSSPLSLSLTHTLSLYALQQFQAWGDFGFFGTADLTSYPPEIARLFDLKLGGGALLDIGIYPLAAVAVGFGKFPILCECSWWFLFLCGIFLYGLLTCCLQNRCWMDRCAFKGRKAPTKVTATGILHTTGADVQGSVALKFGAAETATVNYTIRGETPETVTFIGTKGQIEICTPAHAPTAVKITKATAHGTTATQTFHFPLPATAPGLPPLVFPNSQGFQYEAMAVADAISKGLTEAPEWTLDETMDMMNELDEIRRQLGVVYPAVTAATAPAAPAASPTSGRPTSPLGLQGQQTIAHGFYALFDSLCWLDYMLSLIVCAGSVIFTRAEHLCWLVTLSRHSKATTVAVPFIVATKKLVRIDRLARLSLHPPQSLTCTWTLLATSADRCVQLLQARTTMCLIRSNNVLQPQSLIGTGTTGPALLLQTMLRPGRLLQNQIGGGESISKPCSNAELNCSLCRWRESTKLPTLRFGGGGRGRGKGACSVGFPRLL